jgi:hypothetical protein
MTSCDPLWFDNPTILYSTDKLVEFFPAKDMCMNEKMNALIRLGFYFATIMLLVQKNANYLAIPLGFMLISYIIHTGDADIEKEIDIKDGFYSGNKQVPKKVSECREPTKNNPYMNYIPYDSPTGKAACHPKNIKELEKMEEKVSDIVNKDLFKSTDEVWQKKSNERQFYTMPNTRSMNDQKKFAEWCYGTTKTCKEGNSKSCEFNTRLPHNVQHGWGPGNS